MRYFYNTKTFLKYFYFVTSFHDYVAISKNIFIKKELIESDMQINKIICSNKIPRRWNVSTYLTHYIFQHAINHLII